MPGRVRQFLRGQLWGKSRAHMNNIVEALNQLSALKGDGLVQVTKVAGIGYTFKLNLASLLPLIPKPSQVEWGKAIAAWVAGEDHVHVDPCTPAGADLGDKSNVTGYIVSPTGGDPADAGLKPAIAEGDILAFLALDATHGVLLNVKWAAPGEVPIGGIIMWSGALVDIPARWALCDGTSSTPDLSGRFVMCIDEGGRADEDTVGDTGGYRWHGMTENNHPDHLDHIHVMNYQAVQSDADFGTELYIHQITTANMPMTDGATFTSHMSGMQRGHYHTPLPTVYRHGGIVNAWPVQDPVDEAHANADTDNRPPYYVLAFIMRTS